MVKQRKYLDTGVLIAAIRGDLPLQQAAFNVINDPDCSFFITDFLKLELLPKAVFNGKLTEADFYRGYFETAECVELSSDLVEKALNLACQHGLSAIDALHIQSAVSCSATEFITTEKNTKPFFNVVVNGLRVISLTP